MNKKKIIVAITGASGSIYAKILLDKLNQLSNQIESVGVVMSDNAKDVWKFELDNEAYNDYSFKFYQKTKPKRYYLNSTRLGWPSRSFITK